MSDNFISTPESVGWLIEPGRSLVLVGMMGAGKTTIGRRLSRRLGLPFLDSDIEIEKAAGRTINEIFDDFGEEAFRDGERRVIARLLADEPCVLATGGGAYMDAETRRNIQENGVSVWLKADLEVLAERTERRDTRPMLREGNHREILERLLAEREPIFERADIHVESSAGSHSRVVNAIMDALAARRRRAAE